MIERGHRARQFSDLADELWQLGTKRWGAPKFEEGESCVDVLRFAPGFRANFDNIQERHQSGEAPTDDLGLSPTHLQMPTPTAISVTACQRCESRAKTSSADSGSSSEANASRRSRPDPAGRRGNSGLLERHLSSSRSGSAGGLCPPSQSGYLNNCQHGLCLRRRTSRENVQS